MENLEIKLQMVEKAVGNMHLQDGYNCELCRNKGLRFRIRGEEIVSRQCECIKTRKSLYLLKESGIEKNLEEQKKKRNPEFIEVYETNDELRRVIDMGLKLEGMPKNTSEHAAGVVICNKVLADNVPLARNGDDIVTQFDMKEVEAVGMLKMDFLALTMLTAFSARLSMVP